MGFKIVPILNVDDVVVYAIEEDGERITVCVTKEEAKREVKELADEFPDQRELAY